MSEIYPHPRTYEMTWEVLADLILALRKEGLDIPPNVMEDLRSAKVMINVYKADPKATTEVVPKIEAYLKSVEGNLISLAEDHLGGRFIQPWMERLNRAQAAVVITPRAEAMKPTFIPGLPKEGTWLRVKISEPTSLQTVERAAAQSLLSTRVQEDGYILVYGESERLKEFVKKIAKETVTK